MIRQRARGLHEYAVVPPSGLGRILQEPVASEDHSVQTVTSVHNKMMARAYVVSPKASVLTDYILVSRSD